MGHLRQLILFEKSYLFKRYNNCLNIKCSRRGIVHFLDIGISKKNKNKGISQWNPNLSPPGKNGTCPHLCKIS